MNYFIKIQYKLQRKDRIRKKRKNYSNSSNDVYIMSCKCNSFWRSWTWNFGNCSKVLLIAGATGLLIYNNMKRTQYLKQDDTLAEDFKEWKSTANKSRRIRKIIESAILAIIIAIYLLISFTTVAWHITL